MERVRIFALAIAFIVIAFLVWRWATSTVAPEPTLPNATPTAPERDVTLDVPSQDRRAAPPPSPAPTAQPAPAPTEPAAAPPAPQKSPGLAERAFGVSSDARAQRPESPKAVVTGTITVEGRPAQQLSVNAQLVKPDGSREGVRVDREENGTYSIESPSGELQIMFEIVDESGANPAHKETLTVAAGRIYTLNYDFQASGSIRGEVSGIEEGEYAGLLVLLGEYTIDVTAPEDIYTLADEADGEMTIRGEGKYVIGDLEPGRYTVMVITRLMDEQRMQELNYEFRYVTGYVDVQPGQEAEFNVSLE